MKRNNSTFKNFQVYAGRSITLNELDSGYYQTGVYYAYSYQLYLKARNGVGVESAWSGVYPFSVNRSLIAAPTSATITAVPGAGSNVVKIQWAVNSNAKFYEVYISRVGAGHGDMDFNMISAHVADDGAFYVAMPPGSYRVWLRAWSQEDSVYSVSLWSSGFAFSIA